MKYLRKSVITKWLNYILKFDAGCKVDCLHVMRILLVIRGNLSNIFYNILLMSLNFLDLLIEEISPLVLD